MKRTGTRHLTPLMVAAVTASAWVAAPAVGTTSENAFSKWLSGSEGFEDGMRQHQTSNKAMLVFFYTDWCPYCKRLTKDVLSSGTMQQYLNNVIAVRVNPEAGPREQQLSQTFGVGGYPSVFVLPAGSNQPRPIEPYRHDGHSWVALTASEFVEACENAGKKPKASSGSGSSGSTARKNTGASSGRKAPAPKPAAATASSAPRAGWRPVTLYLKNGNVIDGDLVVDSTDAVVLRVESGDITFSWSEISHLVKHKAIPTPPADSTQKTAPEPAPTP